jgi:hypothetical protein
MIGVPVPLGAGNFSPHPRVQTVSGAHSSSYPVGSRGSFPEVKQPEREADQSPPSSVEVKNAWSYTSTPQYAFMAWCSVKKGQGQLYFYFLLEILIPLASTDSEITLIITPLGLWME